MKNNVVKRISGSRNIVVRYGRHFILLVMLFAVVLYCIKVYDSYFDMAGYTGQSVDGISEHAISFTLTGTKEISFSFLNQEKREFAIMEHLEKSMPIYGVFASHRFFEVSSGRNIEDEDFINDEIIMLCGTNADKICDPAEVELFSGRQVKIIGKIKDKGDILSEYGIIVAERLSGLDYPGRTFILEADTRKNAEALFALVEENLAQSGCTVTRLDRDEAYISNMNDIEEKASSLIVISIILMTVPLGRVIFFWLDQFDEERYAFYLSGLEHINRKMALSYVLIQTSAFVMAMIVAWVKGLQIMPMNLGVLFIVLLILFEACVIYGSVSFKAKHDPDKASRRWQN